MHFVLEFTIENKGKKHEIINSIVIKNNDIEINKIFNQYIYMRPKEKNLLFFKINNLGKIENKLKIILETENGNIEADADLFR